MTLDERPRFFGLYRGKVVSNTDPTGKSRVKAVIPQVLGQNITGWIEPCVPPIYTAATDEDPAVNVLVTRGLPIVGTGIWIMFEAGDPDYPVWIGVSS